MSNWWLHYLPGRGEGWHSTLDEILDYVLELIDNQDCEWTCNENAKPGDHALLYVKAPVSAITAIMQIDSAPRKLSAREEGIHFGKWWGKVSFLEVTRTPLTYQQMTADSELFNGWGLVRAQMQSGTRSPGIKHETLVMLAERIPELARHLRKTGELKKIKTALKQEQAQQKMLADAARIAKAAKPLAEVFDIPVTTVQSWIPRSATPKKTTEPRRSNKKLSTQSTRDNNDRPPSIYQVKPNEVMTTIRDVFSGGGDHDREQLIRQIATHLGYRRVGFVIKDQLGSHINSAVRRGILHKTGQRYKIRSSIDVYSLDKLVTVLLAAMGSKWQTRDKALTAATRHLGFRRTGTKIREAFRSTINAAIRRKKLERDGQNLIRKLR